MQPGCDGDTAILRGATLTSLHRQIEQLSRASAEGHVRCRQSSVAASNTCPLN